MQNETTYFPRSVLLLFCFCLLCLTNETSLATTYIDGDYVVRSGTDSLGTVYHYTGPDSSFTITATDGTNVHGVYTPSTHSGHVTEWNADFTTDCIDPCTLTYTAGGFVDARLGGPCCAVTTQPTSQPTSQPTAPPGSGNGPGGNNPPTSNPSNPKGPQSCGSYTFCFSDQTTHTIYVNIGGASPQSSWSDGQATITKLAGSQCSGDSSYYSLSYAGSVWITPTECNGLYCPPGDAGSYSLVSGNLSIVSIGQDCTPTTQPTNPPDPPPTPSCMGEVKAIDELKQTLQDAGLLTPTGAGLSGDTDETLDILGPFSVPISASLFGGTSGSSSPLRSTMSSLTTTWAPRIRAVLLLFLVLEAIMYFSQDIVRW